LRRDKTSLKGARAVSIAHETVASRQSRGNAENFNSSAAGKSQAKGEKSQVDGRNKTFHI